MAMRPPTISRRTMLGATPAAAVPHLAHGQSGRDPASQKPTDVRIRLTFDGRAMTAALYNILSVRDLATLLPLDLTTDDYGSNEKTAYLPRKLAEDGSGPFGDERPGDLCYFKPWANLAMFYADYCWDGLIRLGRFDGSFEPLRVRGKFPLRIERIR